MTRKEYAAYQRAVCNFFKAEDIKHLSTAHYKCPECDATFDCGTCPQCKKDSGEFPIEPYPSKRRCDCCGDTMYGDRMDANSYCESTREIKEYCICPDCEYYAEYGRLGDMVMLEIEKLPEEFYTFDELEVDYAVKFRGKKAKITTKNVAGQYVNFVVDGETQPYRLYENHVNGSEKLGVYCYGIDS